MLRQRIDVLHAELQQAGASPPAMDEGDERLVNRVLEAVGLPLLPDESAIAVRSAEAIELPPQLSSDDSTLQLPATPAQEAGEDLTSDLAMPSSDLQHAGQNGLDANLDTMSFDDFSQWSWEDNVSPDWPWMTLFAPEFDVPSGLDLLPTDTQGSTKPQARAVTSAGTHMLGTGEATSDDEVDQELVAQIAARFGSLHIAPDGQLRYFGTPTNAHLFTSSKPSGPYTNPRSMRVDGARLLRNAELDQTVDQDIERHLIELYFTWHNSCHPVVDKSLYWTVRQQGSEGNENSGFYSEVLTNAM